MATVRVILRDDLCAIAKINKVPKVIEMSILQIFWGASGQYPPSENARIPHAQVAYRLISASEEKAVPPQRVKCPFINRIAS